MKKKPKLAMNLEKKLNGVGEKLSASNLRKREEGENELLLRTILLPLEEDQQIQLQKTILLQNSWPNSGLCLSWIR